MDGLLLSIRCVLGAVFLVAGAGKLLDLNGSRRALREFGVPAGIARIGGRALPIAEVAVAAGLVVRPSARWAAIGALALLIGFITGIGRAMSQGRAPDCHCFGQLHSEPAGSSTLVRNGVLAGLALVVVAAGPGPSLDGALSGLDSTAVALVAVSVVAALLVAAVLTLWGERGRLKRELATALATRARPGLAPGTPAPEFAASAIRGSAGSLTELRRTGRATILVFLSTNCGPCMEMLGTLAGWQESLARAVTLAPIFSGERDHIARLVEENHLHSALAQVDNEVFDLYELRATPSAVLVDPDGAIASLPAEGVPAIEALIRVAISDADRPHLAVEHA